MKSVLRLIVLCWFAGISGTVAWAVDCASVDSQLNLSIPCIGVGGIYYEVGLERTILSEDPNGYYWAFTGNATLGPYNGQCASTDNNLNILLPCVMVNNAQMEVNLSIHALPSNPEGLYWKLFSYQETASSTSNGIEVMFADSMSSETSEIQPYMNWYMSSETGKTTLSDIYKTGGKVIFAQKLNSVASAKQFLLFVEK